MSAGKLLACTVLGCALVTASAALLTAGQAPLPEPTAAKPELVVVACQPVRAAAELVAAVPIEVPEPPAAPPACPFSETEITMLAQIMYRESQSLCWRGTQWGISYTGRQAAVGWCVLNRYAEGSFGDTLAAVITAPNQFAWDAAAPVTEHFLWLAQDVVDRWQRERDGAQDVGRTLPADYLFFDGNGRENTFRTTYARTGQSWNWDCTDPYSE